MKLETLSDGLKVSVFDRARKPVFKKDSDELTAYGEWVLGTLAWQIQRFPSFYVEIEGHTEAKDAVALGDQDTWELTSSRANVARKKLLLHGVKKDQVRKVAGFSDTDPMPGLAPADEANRRVTVMLRIKQKG
jgi:chemotaxis protein MotB